MGFLNTIGGLAIGILGAALAAALSGVGSANPELKISVREAPGVKCPRCWMHSLKADPETGLCPRCADVVSKL